MNLPEDRLYDLLPAIYRRRDAEVGEPLRQLLRVVAEQVNAVEADIGRLYDDWFIETCQDWVVPYIADLLGYQPAQAGDPAAARARALGKVLTPRRDVGNTLGFRARRGTVAVLPELAAAVAGWPAWVVEYFRLLGMTQDLGGPSRAAGRALDVRQLGRTADLRKGDALDRLGGPFDEVAHRPDVRGIGSHLSRGRYNLPDVGVFVWRLRPYRVTRARALGLGSEGLPHYFSFSVLGNTAPLFTGPGQRLDDTQAPELGVPTPIRRRAFEERLPRGGKVRARASADYYGGDCSLVVCAGNWPKRDQPPKGLPERPIPRQAVIPADLSGWRYVPPRDHIAIDPELGLIAFPPDQLPREHVSVSYYYGFSDDLGGGEYDRPVTPYGAGEIVSVPKDMTLRDALEKWRCDQPARRVIEITDSTVYSEQINLQMTKPYQVLEIRAASGARPVLRLLEWQTDLPNALTIQGRKGGRFILDGLLVTGQGVRVEPGAADGGEEGLDEVVLRHTTLVPGWGLHRHCEPRRPAEPSLELVGPLGRLTVERSILGTIQVTHGDKPRDPFPVLLADSILDSAGPDLAALEATDGLAANVRLTVRNCTVFGPAHAHALDLAQNSIFLGCLCVADHQAGCVRFCYVPPGSRTPRRYHCQPDLVHAAGGGEAECLRVRPRFTSTRYGTPGYAQLARTCAPEITGGADDRSEMGAFHDLFQPQRAANLEARLADFVPAAMDVGIIYVT
jgi:hypothetical protein